MVLGLKELKHNKSKYALIVGILILLVFMVLFLSGLANGLAMATSGAIEDAKAEYYVLSEDADDIITRSTLSEQQFKGVRAMTTDDVTAIDLQRTSIELEGDETKRDITYMAVDPDSFMMPKVIEGNTLESADTGYSIVLDDSFKDDGVEIGDSIIDSKAGTKMKVVGFAKDILYGHSSMGIISTDTYTQIRTLITPSYKKDYNVFAIKGKDVENIRLKGVEVLSKASVISKIPGYAQEQTTINMILWVLVIVSAAILGVFFYVITIQKLQQFGVLKALGADMKMLSGMVIFQVLLLAGGSMIIGNILTFIMAGMLPSSMPFSLKGPSAILISLAFVVISVLCSLISLVKVAKVDPLITIGGKE
ncbi:ABC transporter permease [Clostridium sp. CS001]|uniref:ABC transporter permease n=1 Tax=Clostridium sp. CS001 TaxID=2880648 RepID=UPI001CF3DBF2|nr:ABC transporter permease [Clostridium sp. CS001]MCB2288501.1 ABC transporter permease [Clostridium sp. CS001]